MRAFGFGVVRTFGVAEAREGLAAVCEILSRQLGVVLFPQHATSYRDLEGALDREAVGLAWLPPLLAIDLEDRRRAIPLVLPVRRGTTAYHAAIVARHGVARSLDDLRGKRVAWVDRESAAGYVVPRMHLVAAGFDVAALFAAATFVPGHAAVIDAVLSGRADVGATFCTIDPVSNRVLAASWTAADGRGSKSIELVAPIGPIPNDTLCASPAIPAELRAEIVRRLASPDPALRAALDMVMRADTFRAVLPAHYEPLRRMLDVARTREPSSSRR